MKTFKTVKELTSSPTGPAGPTSPCSPRSPFKVQAKAWWLNRNEQLKWRFENKFELNYCFARWADGSRKAKFTSVTLCQNNKSTFRHLNSFKREGGLAHKKQLIIFDNKPTLKPPDPFGPGEPGKP